MATRALTFPPTARRKVLLMALVLFGISITLSAIGIGWGQPHAHCWHSDSIAGPWTISQMPRLFGVWKHKYPRGHFLVAGVFYKPLIAYWEAHPVEVPAPNGRIAGQQTFDLRRVSLLAMVSRWISAVMGAGAVLAVFFTARVLFRDDLAAFLSGLALAFTSLFVWYSHLGNLDVPATFWFAWSVYWAAQAVYVGKWRHHVLLGVFCAMAVCTKDPVAGYAIGLVLAIWLGTIGKVRLAGGSVRRACTAVLNRRMLAAALVAALVFALLNDLLTTPSAFFERMGHWIGGPGTLDYRRGETGQFHLLQHAYRHLYVAMGWPLLLATLLSAAYCVAKYRWKAAFAIAPVIAFYVIVVGYTRLTVPRYYLPGIAAAVLVTGKALADWLRWAKLPRAVRVAPFAFAYGASLLYCVGVDMELLHDPRYEAERWLARAVTPQDTVVALGPPNYMPRLHLLGSRHAYIYKPKDRNMLRQLRPHATYLVLGGKIFTDTQRFEPELLKGLLDESLGYTVVARFRRRYLWPRKTILGFAGWPRRWSRFLAPEIIILKRRDGRIP